MPITIERCRAPFSADCVDAVARVMACSYAETGLRPWSASEIMGLLSLDSTELWIARCKNRAVIGFLLASIVDIEGEILALGVDPGHQRQKIASRLINEFTQSADHEKLERLILEVAATNEPAITLYEILNFREISVRRDYYRIHGRRIYARLMERRFNNIKDLSQ